MLTDRTPICGHDPQRIRRQLEEVIGRLSCSCLVLDLQRKSEEAPAIVDALSSLSCPVVVSQLYAEDTDTAVLVSPPPLWTPLGDYLSAWKGRTLWLEAATDSALVTVTEAGSSYIPCTHTGPLPYEDKNLHLSYDAHYTQNRAEFLLHRNRQQLGSWLEEAAGLGVTSFLGLYSQLRPV